MLIDIKRSNLTPKSFSGPFCVSKLYILLCINYIFFRCHEQNSFAILENILKI